MKSFSKERVILHCDCNSFFASVETVLNPEYRDVPMAVCGSQSDRHGIVLAKNQLAAQHGIKTAETVVSAKRKCPNLRIASPHHEIYEEYSKRANEIYSRYTDKVEAFGIDESWLDVTASQRLFGNGYEIAQKISRDIKNELGITVSIGVSFNKVFAKLGSDYKKPDAITVINEENVRDIVYPLPVSDLLFVGSKTTAELHKLGVETIGDLASASVSILINKFGKAGEMLHKYACGEDDSPVLNASHEDSKSIGCGFTFKRDLRGKAEFWKGILFLSEKIGTKLRKRHLICSTIQITIKDEQLRSIQRQRPIIPPTNISTEISEAAYELLLNEWSSIRPIRMLTVTALNLMGEEFASTQISMFDTPDDSIRTKRLNADNTADKIRQKYGDQSILKCATIDSDLGILPNHDIEK